MGVSLELTGSGFFKANPPSRAEFQNYSYPDEGIHVPVQDGV